MNAFFRAVAGDMLLMTPRERTICTICAIAIKHGVTYDDVIGPRRLQMFVNPRFEVYRMMRARGATYAQIGRALGRSGSTVSDAFEGMHRRGLRTSLQ